MKWSRGQRWEKFLHRAFEVGIWFKGVDGALELIGGILFLAFSPRELNTIIVVLTQHELHEDPGDLIANSLRHAGLHLYGPAHLIGGAYLLSHGAIKLFLAVGILRKKLWCYPTAIVVMSVFVLLQSVRLGLHFSFLMFSLTLLDIVIVLLIAREYRRIERNRKLAAK